MSFVNPTVPQPGDEAKATDVSLPVQQLADVINGGLDDVNVSGLSGSKIAASSLPGDRLTSQSVTADRMNFSSETEGVWNVLSLGGLKLIWTETASRSTSTSSGSVSTAIPSGLLNTAVFATATPSNPTSEARVMASIISLSATNVTVNLSTPAGAGTAKAMVMIIGT